MAAARGLDFSPLTQAELEAAAFDPAASAGLFVGISRFEDAKGTLNPEFLPIPYAVDDAIELAGLFVQELGLIEARKVMLLLSGTPRKRENQTLLAQLQAQGAQVGPASLVHVKRELGATAARASAGGLLVSSFATHGFTLEGERLLCADSIGTDLKDTGLSWEKAQELLTSSRCPRRLLLVDACREQVESRRSMGAEATRLAEALSQVEGLAVLCAAPPRGFSYDDEARKNGVFTARVLEGLRTGAPVNAEGLVTLEALALWVNERVLEWLQQNRQGLRRGDRPVTAQGITLRLEPLGIGALPLASRRPRQEEGAERRGQVPAAPKPPSVDGKEVRENRPRPVLPQPAQARSPAMRSLLGGLFGGIGIALAVTGVLAINSESDRGSLSTAETTAASSPVSRLVPLSLIWLEDPDDPDFAALMGDPQRRRAHILALGQALIGQGARAIALDLRFSSQTPLGRESLEKLVEEAHAREPRVLVMALTTPGTLLPECAEEVPGAQCFDVLTDGGVQSPQPRGGPFTALDACLQGRVSPGWLLSRWVVQLEAHEGLTRSSGCATTRQVPLTGALLSAPAWKELSSGPYLRQPTPQRLVLIGNRDGTDRHAIQPQGEPAHDEEGTRLHAAGVTAFLTTPQ